MNFDAEYDKRQHDSGMLPAINVLLLRDELAKENIGEYQLLKGTGLSHRDVTSYDSLLTYEQAAACYTNAARLTSRPGIGLRVGSTQSLGEWGTLGYAAQSCCNMKELMQLVQRFQRTAATMADAIFMTEEDIVTIEFAPVHPLHEALVPVAEEHLASACSILSILTGQKVPLLQISLPYARPHYHRQYKALFDCPIYFDEPRIQMLVKAEFLDAPIIRSNPGSASLAKRICLEQMKLLGHESEMASKVRYHILLAGNEFATAEAIAERMQITSRTLRNRLKREGTSFQRLLDDVRMKLAIDYLSTSSMQVGEVARLLGFSDQSNFGRAFRKWTGKNPRDFRNRG